MRPSNKGFFQESPNDTTRCGSPPNTTPCQALMGAASLQFRVADPASSSRMANKLAQSSCRPKLPDGTSGQMGRFRSLSATPSRDSGMGPAKSLPPRRSKDSWPNAPKRAGMGPLSRLPRKRNSRRFASSPSCGGTEPLRALPSSDSTFKPASLPSSGGSRPSKRSPSSFNCRTRNGAPPSSTPFQAPMGTLLIQFRTTPPDKASRTFNKRRQSLSRASPTPPVGWQYRP